MRSFDDDLIESIVARQQAVAAIYEYDSLGDLEDSLVCKRTMAREWFTVEDI